ncbi:MAG: hypothetical protein JXA77_18785 [Bacteroidales bacterium]|nr:hypothetical protein [Bacteroidales bacterium]MBN2821480.1 hypothetical protein [Bacteroidales bacterium]
MKKPNNLRISFILEIFWLIIFIFASIKGLIETFKMGFEGSYVFFIISALALFLFLARRNLRRNTSENNS